VKAAYGALDLSEFGARVSELRTLLEPPSDAGDYVAYTDGACFGNPSGRGGWAAVVFPAGGQAAPWLLFGHLSSSSNNRAEALGVLAALEWVPGGSHLYIHSDSELTVRQLQGRYKIKANVEIWDRIQRTRADKHIELSPEWVRAHVGDPLNELADRLSKLGANSASLDAVATLEDALPPVPAELAELVGLEPRTDWERDFVNSVRDQLRRGRSLSPKQQAVIDRIRTRPSG